MGDAKLGLCGSRRADDLAEAQGVDRGAAVYQLTSRAADGGFAIGFDGVA